MSMQMVTASTPRLRAAPPPPPCLLLVKVEDDEIPTAALMVDWGCRVLHARQPLPACARIEAVRPAVVLVGRAVRDQDFVLLVSAAHRVGAEILRLGPRTVRDDLAVWVRLAMEDAARRCVARP